MKARRMLRHLLRYVDIECTLAAAIALGGGWSALLPAATWAAELASPVSYARDVRPILAQHCFSCHGPDAQSRQAELRLDTLEGQRDSGAVIPGDSEHSPLMLRVLSDDPEQRMPPPSSKRVLTAAQKQTLEQWIQAGAPVEGHWAYQPPQRASWPQVLNLKWTRHPIDTFVLAELERRQWSPSPEAARSTILRRVTLDLTGLPPSPDEVADFIADDRPDAYERVVDRLLASPRFGERLAQVWLDVARYADTNGYNNDEERVMWRWRDWVLHSLNGAMPYDQFLHEQLAGDLLPNATLDQRLASGFNRNHVFTTEGGIIEEEYRVEYVSDRLQTTSSVFLGITMQCARCHDHKYDPISQREYYQLFSFFNQCDDKLGASTKPGPDTPLMVAPTATQSARMAQLEQECAAIETQLAQTTADTASPEKTSSSERLTALRNEMADLEKTFPTAIVMRDLPESRPDRILIRGEYDKPGESVESGVPAQLGSWPDELPRNRLGLARWLLLPQNPLPARVAVNRWWALLFGTGLVETEEDFGIQGSLPSHPELLDWLAVSYRMPRSSDESFAYEWDTKTLIRAIVTSATYRQDSASNPELRHRDPANRWLARGPRYRLSAEQIRDGALAASGLLVEQIGGPSVRPYQPAGLWEEVSVLRREKYEPSAGAGLYRRSMYTFWKRTCPPPSMNLLDAPDREFCVIRRARTNTPLQALALLNDVTYIEAARKLAERILHPASASDGPPLSLAYQSVLAREPDAAERTVMQRILDEARQRYHADAKAADALLHVGAAPYDPRLPVEELAAWTVVCNVLLNLDETITKE